MAKQITIEYNKRQYILEFTRESVVALERSGFKIGDLADYPNLMLPKLFFGAFKANHPSVRQKLTDEILDKIKNKNGLIDKLTEMYAEPLETLFDDEKGNVEWEATGF